MINRGACIAHYGIVQEAAVERYQAASELDIRHPPLHKLSGYAMGLCRVIAKCAWYAQLRQGKQSTYRCSGRCSLRTTSQQTQLVHFNHILEHLFLLNLF